MSADPKHIAHAAHIAKELAEDAVNDDDQVRGTAKAAGAGAAAAVGGAMVVTALGVATAPVTVPLVVAGAAVGAIGRWLARGE